MVNKGNGVKVGERLFKLIGSVVLIIFDAVNFSGRSAAR
jgi:hypothetical protein